MSGVAALPLVAPKSSTSAAETVEEPRSKAAVGLATATPPIPYAILLKVAQAATNPKIVASVKNLVSQTDSSDSHSFETVRIKASVKCYVFREFFLRSQFLIFTEIPGVFCEQSPQSPRVEGVNLAFKLDSPDSHSFETVRIKASERCDAFCEFFLRFFHHFY